MGPLTNKDDAAGGARLRVLALASLFPSRYRPGRASFNQQQFTALASLCRLSLVAPVPFVHLFTPVEGRIRPPSFPFPVARPVYWYPPRWGRQLHGRFYFWSAWPTLRRTAARLHPQVLLANWLHPDGWAGREAARRLGLPLVVQVLGSDLVILKKDPKRLPLLRKTLRAAQAVMTVDQSLRQEALAAGAYPERVFVVDNGVDATLFHPQDRFPARRRLGLAENRPVVLFIGNLVPVKGLDVALRALARLPETDLVVAGAGPLAGSLRAQAAGLGLAERVIWAGQVDHRQIPDYLAACDALVLPSLSEGQPNVVLEALSSGRPVVASAVGGVAGLIKDGEQGFLVPPGDPVRLAQALARVLGQDWDPQSLAAAVAGRSWGKSAAGLLQVLEYAVREYGPL